MPRKLTPSGAPPDPTSTNPWAWEAKDDRPLVRTQQSDGRWKVLRTQEGHPDGGKIVGANLTREEADTRMEIVRATVPRTDTSRQASTRRTFYGFNVPEGGLK